MNKKITGKRMAAPVLVASGLGLLAVSNMANAADPSFEVSGQINAALVFGGDVQDPEVVDNTASGSRFRIRASRDAFNGQRAF